MNTRSHNRRLKRKNQKDNVTEIVKRLDIHNGDTIVDIGSGNGSITLEFSRLAGETGCVFAADIDRELLEQIRNIEMPYDNVHTLYLENDRISHCEYSIVFQSAGRAGVISVRDADDEHQSGGRSRQPHEADTGAPDCQSVFRRVRGGRNHGNHPVLIRHNRHGGGLRQLPAHDA